MNHTIHQQEVNRMKNSLFVGMAIGMLAGAYIVNNNKKARQLVSDAQEQIMAKFQKQGAMQGMGDEMQSQSQEN